MHNVMKQIIIYNGRAQPIFACFLFEIFHDRVGPGFKNGITVLALPGFQIL